MILFTDVISYLKVLSANKLIIFIDLIFWNKLNK